MPSLLQRLSAAIWTPSAPEVVEAAAPQRSDKPLAAAGTQERNQQVLGAGMTPGAIATALRLADQGEMQRLCDIASEQRTKVTHLQTVLSTRESTLSGCDLEIEPRKVQGANAKKAAQKVADYVAERFDAIPMRGDMVAHLAAGIYYPASAVGLDLKRDRNGVGIRGWSPVHPRRISYAGPDMRRRIYDAGGNDVSQEFGVHPGVDVAEKYPYRFVFHAPLTLGAEYPWRQGLCRVLVWMGMFWTWTNRDWYQFAELFGKPLRIGKYDKLAEKRDIDALKSALASLGGMSTAVIANTCDADLKWPAGGGASVHEKLRAAQNAEISKVVLGQTATTELGDHASYASGKVAKQVQQEVLNSDGRALGDTLTRQLAYPLVMWRFGREVAEKYCPRVDVLTAPDADLDGECKRAVMLVNVGVPLGTDALRERFTTLPKPAETDTIAHPERQQGDQDETISDEKTDTAGRAEKKAPTVEDPDKHDDEAEPAGDDAAED